MTYTGKVMGGKNITIVLVAILSSIFGFSQVSGTVKDKSSGRPIPYVNVWIKNSLIGATTGMNGKFIVDKGKVGDTIHVSSLGYSTIEFLAEEENEIRLEPKIDELDEVVLIPKKNTIEYSIISFKKVKKRRNWYNNGHYSLARFYKHKNEYDNTPFIDEISLITLSAKKSRVIFRIRLVKPTANGEPSEDGLTDNILIESGSGVNEIVVVIGNEKITVPQNGFFVIVDRLNMEENKSFNKIAGMDILQPAIGMERIDQERNTWFGFGGKWIAPMEMKKFLGTNGNIAVNIKLTD